jgi:hypothetical protein
MLYTFFIGANIFPLLVIISSAFAYAGFAMYKQMKIEIKEEV